MSDGNGVDPLREDSGSGHTADVRRTWQADHWIWLLSTCLAATGALLWWRGLALPDNGHLWWPVLAVLFALSERFAVHLPFGRDNHSLTFGQAPLVLGLFFLDADELLIAALGGAAVVWVLVYRHPPIKLAFNLASLAAQVTVACAVFIALLDLVGGQVDTVSPRTWVAAVVAVLAGDLLSNLAVFVIVSLRQTHWDALSLGRTLASAAVGSLVVTDLALLAAVVLQTQPWATALLGAAVALSFLLFRGYQVQRLRYGRLELLYRFTRSVDQALQDSAVADAICAEARELLRATYAQVISCPGRSTGVQSHAEWWSAACDGELVRLPRGGNSAADSALHDAGHHDGMAVPLREGGAIVGVLVVADRLDELSTFDAEDSKLFEALAGHASVALANSGLVDRVRAAAQETEYLSLHDPLTGLPNRLHFLQRLERRLGTTGSAAVLLMDVDRFKEVNDTLGHDIGDQLLQEVARRLRRLESEETVVARLGGDEFAVLLGGDDVHVEGMVTRIRRDIARPVRIGEVTLDVTASIGIAATPQDGSSAALLLRRAEVAMYDAKVGLSEVARYSPDRDPNSSRRLSLIGDLARALENGALEVHYQPQAEPADGKVTGVEALLRWKHPVWGFVPPDEFVPLAEQTGLIRSLTHFVLQTAVHQAVSWRDAGTPVLMAVNISARNLLEPDLADNIARLLLQAGLPAALLKLEVTESAIVAEPERALAALERLVDLGLTVSVDDFGTGYSSLTRLRAMPVDEVKIDRAFVRGLGQGSDDLAIVRAVINLGHDLGLRVVAEGVEDQESWQILHDLGCDLVQGYYLARPMPAEAMTPWLHQQLAAFATRLHPDPAERRPSSGSPSPTQGPALGNEPGKRAHLQ